MVKQAMRRVYPDFNEGYYGYRSFSDLLEDAERAGCSTWSTTKPGATTR